MGDYVPKKNEEVCFYDKKLNYRKKKCGKVVKVGNKYVTVNSHEEGIINFERTEAFQKNVPITKLSKGDQIKFKRSSRQKEYYNGKIVEVGDKNLEIRYIQPRKVDIVLLEQNFSVDKIKKRQEIHGKVIPDSVYEKRLKNRLQTDVDERRQKLEKSVEFYRKSEVFPQVPTKKLLDQGKSPSLVMYADLVQKRFFGNNCKSLEKIDEKDKCNERYYKFGQFVSQNVINQPTIEESKKFIKDLNETLYTQSEYSYLNGRYFGIEEKKAKEKWIKEKQIKYYNELKEKNPELWNDVKIEDPYFQRKFRNKYWKWLDRDVEKASFWELEKYYPQEVVEEAKNDYQKYVEKKNNERVKFKIQPPLYDTISEKFKKFISSPSRKDKKYLEDIETINKYEKNFSEDFDASNLNFYNETNWKEPPINVESKEDLPKFAHEFLVNRKLYSYMQGKGGVRSKFNKIVKILKKNDKKLSENRFGLEELSLPQLDKKIQDEFGLRAIQYGISVKKAKESYQHDLLELIYGSFKDLSTATNLDSRYIGLSNINYSTTDQSERDSQTKGNLGIAIGARGHGHALAHYEPDLNVINLTKSRGNGSLAHEWGHAFDRAMRFALNDEERVRTARNNLENIRKEISHKDLLENMSKYTSFLSKYDRGRDSPFKISSYMSENYLSHGIGDIIVRNYERTKFSKDVEDLVYKIRNSDFCQFSNRVDPNYLGEFHECFARAFESYVGDKTQNRFLATNTNEHTLYEDIEMREKIGSNNILLRAYPQNEYYYNEEKDDYDEGYMERKMINESFEKVFSHKKELQSTIDNLRRWRI